MDFVTARKNMIECQLRPNKVSDEELLAAMSAVPRESFVPAGLQTLAYLDEDLRLGEGRWLMEPVVMARLIQELQLGASDVVLDIASGTGYAAAVMARLSGTVFALENEGELRNEAARLHSELVLDNVIPVEGSLAEGCAEHAPYSAILIEGAVERIPDAILAQLADHGRLAAVVVEEGIGRATVIRKDAGHLSRRVVFDAYVPVLGDFRMTPGFVF